MMQVLDNGQLLQRRGRWANRKMMDIYVQEITALMCLQRVPPSNKDLVTTVASSFTEVVDKAELPLRAKIPARSWHILFQT